MSTDIEQRVLFKKLHEDAIIPKKQREGDAAFDLYAIMKCTVRWNDHRSIIPTGIAMAIPEGYVGIIKGRSGLAVNYGLDVLGGVIDSNYRGEVRVIVDMNHPTNLQIKKGDRVAQLLVVPIHTLGSAEVDELPENLYRGDAGFGSSGV